MALIVSMTGFGESSCQQEDLYAKVEVRTINNRYLKISLRTTEGYGLLKQQIEGIVRQTIKRGSIQIQLHIDRTRSPHDCQINACVLDHYYRQLKEVSNECDGAAEIRLESLLNLPGVVNDVTEDLRDPTDDWATIRQTLDQALENLTQMRVNEGAAISLDLISHCQEITLSLDAIQTLAPKVIDDYRQRLTERVNQSLAELHVSVEPSDLIREVSLFSERSDISEEIVRLRSHLEQFDSIMKQTETSGRKLDFLTQEMFREANTVGSKANNVQIARHVIDIKAAIERIREQVQNVE